MENVITEIKSQFPSLQIGRVKLPDGHSLNDMLVNYGSEAILTLIDEAEALTEQTSVQDKTNAPESDLKQSETQSQTDQQNDMLSALRFFNSQKIGYQGKAAYYFVLGNLSTDMGSMAITLQVDIYQGRKLTRKVDLYDNEQVEHFCIELSEKEGLNANLLQLDLMQLSDLLTAHRDTLIERAVNSHIKVRPTLTPEKEAQAVKFLTEQNLVKRMDELISESGVIGEESNRTMLFVCASTYKNFPLHVLVQGTSGSGKSHLINAIKECIPQEEVINLTRVTSKSFYHYQGEELMNKLIVIQDFDGLDEEAQLAFREAQSAKYLTTSTVHKDRYGNLNSQVKHVNAHFSSMVATTKAEVYFDNMSRSVVIGVDESEEQTSRIIQYQNKRFAGLIDLEKEQQAKELLQNCIRVLKPYKVINRYADKITLPMEAKMLRRLNEQFQLFVFQVAFLHQYQRDIDTQHRIVATPEDLRMATELFFNAIWLKVDELDSSTRQFFERLKSYNQKQSGNKLFTQREVRLALNQSKSQCFRYFEELQRLEYIAVSEGTANRGFKYRITHWDEWEKLRNKVRAQLLSQIDKL